uniref:Uncharacterized protein n=1 Tax=Nelumbo nucifera TaxID=4432 RepID=A0A822YGV4_NELNU|nr:TPA_asm: hypothetical protein HUJ06_009350 [Nelumbo nucifera]
MSSKRMFGSHIECCHSSRCCLVFSVILDSLFLLDNRHQRDGDQRSLLLQLMAYILPMSANSNLVEESLHSSRFNATIQQENDGRIPKVFTSGSSNFELIGASVNLPVEVQAR